MICIIHTYTSSTYPMYEVLALAHLHRSPKCQWIGQVISGRVSLFFFKTKTHCCLRNTVHQGLFPQIPIAYLESQTNMSLSG
jgi:hypothetical protein